MITVFTDTDYAVIYDSLAANRERLQADGIETPNVDAAMEKLGKWADPRGCQFLAISGPEAREIAREMTEVAA